MDNTSVVKVASPDEQKISVLAPGDGTFSAEAIRFFHRTGLFGSLPYKQEDFILVPTNGGVIPSVIEHGGWGVLAMETLVGGRVSDSLDPLVGLIDKYKRRPFCIVAAVEMELHFCLMAKQKISWSEIEGVIAHPKAIDACRAHVSEFKARFETSSNGEAARLVAKDDRYCNWVALGPKSAAEIYGLEILHEAFEDKRAVTTFFLFGPNSNSQGVYVGNYIGKNNRVLIICKLNNISGALNNVIQPFSAVELNLIQIYSVADGDGGYNFAIEVEVSEDQLDRFEVAMAVFKLNVIKYLSFGPFVVLEG